MLSAGERATLGLLSPSDRVIERGDPFTMAFGLSGALTARAGFAVEDEGELPEAIRDYVDRLAAPYFACAAEWYETIGIGVTGGEIDALVKRHLGDPFFNIFLNPGHLIHLDEWMNTPIYPGSTERLQSGQAIQLDIIPATGSPYFTSNIEDGIALLDARGREEFAEKHPGAWLRIEARRALHGRRARHPIEAGGPAVQQPARLSGALRSFSSKSHGSGIGGLLRSRVRFGSGAVPL